MPAPVSTKKPPSRPLRSAVMLMRRIHLYSGLFMLPWVLLYAITGWFFNHPGILKGDQSTRFDLLSPEGVPSTPVPSATSIVEQFIEALNRGRQEDGLAPVTLSTDRPPSFRDPFSFTASGETASHIVTINPNGMNGHVQTTLAHRDETLSRIPNPLQGLTRVRLDDNPYHRLKNEIPAILAPLDLPVATTAKARGQARVVFEVIADDTPTLVTYNLVNGTVRSVVETDRRTLGARAMLEKLHLSRGYPPGLDTRWFWALAVDGMVVSMIFWGISGLFMWWQLKHTRKAGFAVLALSLATAATFSFRMHDKLTEQGPKPPAKKEARLPSTPLPSES